MPIFALNQLVLRQTRDSRFSHVEVGAAAVHWNGFWEPNTEAERVVLEVVNGNWDLAVDVPGRPGVKKITVHGSYTHGKYILWFYSGVTKLTPDLKWRLRSWYNARIPGENPYIQTEVYGIEKPLALYADLILYNHEALGTDASTDADWELVSINARVSEQEEPPTPMAMARNFLCLPGGSEATYTAEEFAKSIAYWSQHAMIGWSDGESVL